MKVVVLSPNTNNCVVLYQPLRRLGHCVEVIIYDTMTYEEHENLPALIDLKKPDWVLLLGAIETQHGHPVPCVRILGEIGKKYPLVNFCCDSVEILWWQQLESYYAKGHFALQVGVDGVRAGPIGLRGMTTLCPVDEIDFINQPWSERKILCGFSGFKNRGPRSEMITALQSAGLLYFRDRDSEPPDEYRRFLANCKITFNHPMTGGGGWRHVKARVLEAALSGCVVLEASESPVEDWFTPGVDYLEYSNVETAREKIAWVESHQDEAREMAMRLRARVIEEHSPAVFWGNVLWRIGLGAEPARKVRELSLDRWLNAIGMAHPIGWPAHVETAPRANVVTYGGRYYMVPHKLGEIDLDSPGATETPGIEMFNDKDEAVKAAHRYG